MTDSVVVVTGASRGLGAAVARIAARLGARVVLTARSRAGLQAVADSIQADGGTALVVPGDIGQAADCQQVVAATVEAFGRLDALVNNAGIIDPIARIAEADPAAWDHLLHINVTGVMQLTQAALPYLRAAQGRVINVSSGASENPKIGWSAYSVSKAALNMLNRALAEEEPDVIAIALRPGVVDTAMQQAIRDSGAGGMEADEYQRFVNLHTNHELNPPDVPGRAIAVLALHAPARMSGNFVHWDDDDVQALIRRYAPTNGR
jgi:NAD(P)-dependent dehydrogenase (short-subunit alcohol dehydrogenase family)